MHQVHVSLDVNATETRSIKNNMGIIGNDVIRVANG